MSYTPATKRTIYFIGTTTGQSSIMKVFPRWAEALKLNAVIKGIDFVPDEGAPRYREAVCFIKRDPLSLGALVTTHKVNLLKASRDLFDELDPYAETLGEISSISKRHGRLCGHAKDPITVGRALEAIVDEGYWRRTGGELLNLGAGGSSMALTLYLHTKAKAGRDVPARVVVTALDGNGLADIREVHRRIGIALPIDYAVTPEPAAADRLLTRLPRGSMVVNATGLGRTARDRPSRTPQSSHETASRGNSTIAETSYSSNRRRRRRRTNLCASWMVGSTSSTAGRLLSQRCSISIFRPPALRSNC